MYPIEHLVFESVPFVHRQGFIFQLSPYISDDTRLRGYLHVQLLLIHHVGGTSGTWMRPELPKPPPVRDLGQNPVRESSPETS